MTDRAPTLKEVYGKGVRAMANTKAPMFQKGGPPGVKPSIVSKAAPPARTHKPFMCPRCNYRDAKTGYCPNCGERMAKAQRKRGSAPVPGRY